ncbi:MAG: EipB family protein [Rhodospirillaceae bacterium]
MSISASTPLCALVTLTIAAGAFSPLAAAPAQAEVTLTPHQAVYRMTLDKARDDSIVGADGYLSYRMAESCSGWTTNMVNTVVLSFADGRAVEREWILEAEETRENGVYSFFTRDIYDGDEIKRVEGTALMQPDGSGTVSFAQPDDMEDQTLPVGTLFPNAHSLALLKAAVEGKVFASEMVYDGGEDGAVPVVASIGKRVEADMPGELDDPLLKTPSWPMSLAFFDPTSDDATPTYEVRLRYHENGVAQNMLQDFGSFSLRSELLEIEVLEVPEC